MILSTFILGLVVGLISSVLGLGGGILIVPILPLVTDLSRKESVFVSLFAILVIVLVNTISFLRQKKVDKRAAFIFGPMTAVGAVVAVQFISPHFTNEGLRITLAMVLLFWGGLNVYKVFIQKSHLTEPGSGDFSLSKKVTYFALALGAGALSGLLGIGSGLIISLLFVGLAWLDTDKISPSSNAVMVFTTLAGALTYMAQLGFKSSSEFALNYSLPIIAGALITSYFGRKIQGRVDRKLRAIILIVLLFVLSARTLVS